MSTKQTVTKQVESLTNEVEKLKSQLSNTRATSSDLRDEVLVLKNNYLNFTKQVIEKFEVFEKNFRKKR